MSVPGRKYKEASTPPDSLGEITGHRHQIVVDWDGTCVTSTWPEKSTEWMPGAVEALHDMSAHSNVIIFSARTNPHLAETGMQGRRPDEEVAGEIAYIRRMLDREGLHHVGIWTNHGKPGGDLYIDDKAERYNGRKHSWARIAQKVRIRFGTANGTFPPWEEHDRESESTPA